jgi:hypothetical protein
MAALAAYGTGVHYGISSMKKWSEQVLASQEHLRQFSGVMANTYARLERQQLRLDAKTARETAGSNKYAADSYMRMREALQPLEVALTNATNVTVGVGANLAAIATKFDPTIRAIVLLNEALKSGKDDTAGTDKDMPYIAHLNDYASGRWDEARTKRPGE